MDTNNQSQWERVAQTRWGMYITNIETQVLSRAAGMTGHPGTVFDFGCGEGRWVGFLSKQGWQANCGDVDPVALAKCSARNPGSVCVPLDRNGKCIPAADNSVDLVLCIEVPGVLESDWFRREANRVLKPGGMIVGIMHNRQSARGAFRAITDGWRRQYCFYQMGFRHWKSLMQGDGFKVVHAEGLCWFPFGRASSSPLIRPCIALERVLGLRSLPALSPWVVFIAAKTAASQAAQKREGPVPSTTQCTYPECSGVLSNPQGTTHE